MKLSWTIAALLVSSTPPQERTMSLDPMIVSHAGSQPTSKGSADSFTGDVFVEPAFPAANGSRSSGAYVTFEAGARSAWHTHPAGQTLIVISGTGWVQQWGGEKRELKAGDVVWTPPGVKHWHGATPKERMTHVALQEAVNGTPVTWMEKVTETQYLGK